MIKKMMLLLTAVTTMTAPAFAAGEILLAPVDPLSWAVANGDWGVQGASQIDALRKVVNGQVTAHQLTSSYTDPKTRVVKRIKCADPANCIMCSDAARESGKKLRDQVSNSAGSAQGAASIYTAAATYAQARADAINAQSTWQQARSKSTITETSMVDGQEVTTTKTVTVEDPAAAEVQKTEQVLAQLKAAAQAQAQQQGSLVYTYLGAAVGNLTAPAPAVELYMGEDPLR